MAAITIYTQPYCPYCIQAVRLLKKKGAAFEEISVPSGTPARAELAPRVGGRTSVPQIFVDGTHIGDCDALLALDRAGKLDTLLAA